MADIFISYAAEDRDRARQLALALEERGWDVWWDREIPLGRLYDDAIEQALAAARCAIVLWSRGSIASEWVRSEASEAKRRGILVPVFLEAVEPPLAFRLLHGADLTAWEAGSPHEEFEQLTRRVGELLAHTTQGSAPVRAQAPLRDSGAAHPSLRHWWWAVAAAALLLLVIGVLLTGAHRGRRMQPSGDPKPSAATASPSRPAPARKTQRPPAARAPVEPTYDDPSGLMSALQDLMTPDSRQSSLAAVTAFEVKELAVKIMFVSDEQASALGALGLSAGAVVIGVGPGPAQKAGLHAGDVVTSIGGAPIRNVQDLRRAVRRIGPGKTRYRLRRDGRTLDLDIDCPACTAS